MPHFAQKVKGVNRTSEVVETALRLLRRDQSKPLSRNFCCHTLYPAGVR
jgi:hypothetical protein